MTGEKTKLGITKFFEMLLKSFPKLLLTNLLFAVPFVAFVCGFYFLGRAINFSNLVIICLAVIPLMPFYAGITLVTRNIVRGDEYVPIFQTFKRGIKENWVKFLIHGVVMYAAIIFSYFSIVLYSNFAQQNAGFYAIVILCIIISIGFVFMFFNLPLMTVTFDIPLKDVYKNCALMSFGELKSNFLGALGVFLLGIFCLSFLIFSGTSLWVVILTIIFAVFLVPAVMAFIINYSVYKGMMSLLVSKEKRKEELERELKYKKNPALKKADEAKKLKEDFSDLVIDENDNSSDDEYIFHNGKMVKRSVLIRQMKELGEIDGQAKEE